MILPRVLALAVGLAGSLAAAPDPVTVPLQLVNVGTDKSPAYKLGIYVALGGAGVAKLYEFDTGASGLYAAYNAQWWPSFTSTGTPANQTYHSKITYNGTVVTTALTIFSDATTPTAASIPSVNVAQIQSATYGGTGHNPVANWNSDVSQGIAPLFGAFFGDFGMDLGTKNGIFGVLPQLPEPLCDGFIVHVGRFGASQPTLQIGITDADRATFPYAIKMRDAGKDGNYPGSGLPTYSQKLIKGTITLAGEGKPFSFDSDLIFDTGQPTTEIHDGANAFGIPPRYQAGGDLVKGSRFSLVGETSPWEFGFVVGNVVGINAAWLQTGGTSETNVNVGLNVFTQYDVLFDVKKGHVMFRPVPASYGVRLRKAASKRGELKFAVINSGLVPGPVKLRGNVRVLPQAGGGGGAGEAPARRRIFVECLLGGKNVTTALRRGRLQTESLLPGEVEDLTILVRVVGRPLRHTRELAAALTAACVGNPAMIAHVKGRLRF
jgi:hypothetical protein